MDLGRRFLSAARGLFENLRDMALYDEDEIHVWPSPPTPTNIEFLKETHDRTQRYSVR